MKLDVPKGRYVLAVSGGVDSMSLLNMLSNLPDVDLVVAHFDHGMREDSAEDAKFVANKASQYGLAFAGATAGLGKTASEDTARTTRYAFLELVKKTHNARAIVTAHHQDDLIETAFINMLRGTGRRGLTSMAQNPEIIRPLLNTPKSELIKYAKAHKLEWREDSTNQETRYLRNYIRIKIIPGLSVSQREDLLDHITELNRLNPILDQEIANLSQTLLEDNKINRQKFIALPPEIATEVLAHILRQEGIRQFDKKTLERLSVAIKTAKPGTSHDVMLGIELTIDKDFAQILRS